MDRIQPRLYNGTRDIKPEIMIRREEMMDQLRVVFNRFGFVPLETPALEYLEILMGKYGDEEKLIYKLDYKNDDFSHRLALRYDLTVPLARFVAMQPDLLLPFKRYQMQPVWRADRPQPRQGRFREFYQCDIDIIGVDSVEADAEILLLQAAMLKSLGLKDFRIRLNDRRILSGLVTKAGIGPDLESQVCLCIDKLNKIGRKKVAEEMSARGIDPSGAQNMLDMIDREIDWDSLDTLHEMVGGVDAAEQAVEQLGDLKNVLENSGADLQAISVDLHLARGLGYYTGTIFETVVPSLPHMGSVTGGGRYDGLVGMYASRDLPATGATIGLDRLIAALTQLELMEERSTRTSVLVTIYFPETKAYCRHLAARLRESGINTETFLAQGSLKKQFSFADRKGIRWVVVAGEDELKSERYTLKDLETGRQMEVSFAELLEKVK